MDPLMAAAERVVGYLVPYALDKTVALAKKIGKDAVDKIAGWLDRLRDRWAGDEEASAALADFEHDPANNAERLQTVLADRMAKDESLADSAEHLANDVGPTVVVIMRGGDVEVQTGASFGNVRRGQVHVEQTLAAGKQMSGPTFKDIG
jgi:hypothetical protein